MPAPSVKTPKTPTSTVTPPTNGTKKGAQPRDVIYPRYEVLICCCPTPDAATGEMVEYDGPITVEQAKKLLGWEDDDEYVRRRMTEDIALKESKLRESDFLLKDRKGSKIRCRHNTLNRPFDEKHAKKLAQDILTEGYEMNGEDIIIGRTGLVLSGQHRLIGLVIAYEDWLRNGRAYQKYWNDVEPYIESVVFMGCREDQAILQTFDNVKPRALSDTIYTSPIFANKRQSDKKRCSVMMDHAIDWLWRRLDATSNKFVEYQTNSASLDFLDRHEKHMIAAVKHIHDLDGGDESGHGMSGMYLNAGRAAGMLFLMGSSGTTEEQAETYHALTSPKKERQLDWRNWENAMLFWSEIIEGRETKRKDDKGNPIFEKPLWVEELRKALGDLGDSKYAGSVSDSEKAAVVALAWAEYVEGNEDFVCGKPGKENSIVPETVIDRTSNSRKLVDGGPIFGFADKGSPQRQSENKDTPEPTEKQDAEAIRLARTEKLKKIEEHNSSVMHADIDKKVVPSPSPRNPGPLNGGRSSPPVSNGETNKPKKTGKGKSSKKGEEEFIPTAEDLTEAAIEEGDDDANPLPVDDSFSLADEDALTDHMNAETIKDAKEGRKAARAAKKQK